MAMTVPRFEPINCKKGIKFTIENNGVIVIKDHSNDKIIGMVNLDADVNKNIELAEKIIETIEDYITDPNE